jgi:RNA ligase (TIGR02306 family)
MENLMSDFKVPYTKILEVKNHPNADKLSIYRVYGFEVIGQKDKYKVGDCIVYVPVDSILKNDKLERKLFPLDAKIKLNKSRIRQIRIRQYPSQGMLINPKDVEEFNSEIVFELEADLAEDLDIVKYEPPAVGPSRTAPGPRNKPKENPRLHKYNGVENLKWTISYFEGQDVVIQEKLHGSNCRFAYAKRARNTLWKKLIGFLGLLPKYEACWGSNNVQLHERNGYTGYYGKDIYKEVLEKVGAFKKVRPGESIYGELIGPGIQANYTYGKMDNHFVLFDVKKEREDGSQEFLDPDEVEAYAHERGFDFVPVLYRGPFQLEQAKALSQGPSVYSATQTVREGCVIKRAKGYGEMGTKHAKKLINPAYLDDQTNSDFH